MPPKKSNLNNASSKGSRRKRVERAQQLPEQIETRNAAQRIRTAESRAQESQEQRDERLQQNITRTRAARERNIATVRVLDRQRQRISRSLTRASFVRLAFEYAPDINYSAHSKIAIGGVDKVCQYCQTLQFRNEAAGMCCASGKVVLSPLPAPPEPLLSLLTGNSDDSKLFLQDHNQLIQLIKRVSPRLQNDNYQIVIKADKVPLGEHAGRFNAPTVDEVAVIMVGDPVDKRSIKITRRDNTVSTISDLHRSYDALQYPLIFWQGQDEYHLNIKQYDPNTGDYRNNKVSSMNYYAHRIMVRQHQDNYILRYRQLFHQYIVDMYAKVESERLRFLRLNQAKLRSEEYIHLRDAVAGNIDGNLNPNDIGNAFILPSSYIGSPRNRQEYIQDAMTYVRHYGRPDLFITFTCNPNWEEIQTLLLPGQQAIHRHDLTARVFKQKLKSLIDFIVKYSIFGITRCWLYTIEWQKRGLPHVHILVWLKDRIRPEEIDQIISAEIPDPLIDQELFDIVTKHMIHGPCGAFNMTSPCMENGKSVWLQASGLKGYEPREMEAGDLHVRLATGMMNNGWLEAAALSHNRDMHAMNGNLDAVHGTKQDRTDVVDFCRSMFWKSATIQVESVNRPSSNVAKLLRNLPYVYYCRDSGRGSQVPIIAGTIHQSMIKWWDEVEDEDLIEGELVDSGSSGTEGRAETPTSQDAAGGQEGMPGTADLRRGVVAEVQGGEGAHEGSGEETEMDTSHDGNPDQRGDDDVSGTSYLGSDDEALVVADGDPPILRWTELLRGKTHDYRVLALKVDLYDELREKRIVQPTGVDYAWAGTEQNEPITIHLCQMGGWHYDAIFVTMDMLEVGLRRGGLLRVGSGNEEEWALNGTDVRIIPLGENTDPGGKGRDMWVLSHLTYPLTWVVDTCRVYKVGGSASGDEEMFIRTAGLVDIHDKATKIIFLIPSKSVSSITLGDRTFPVVTTDHRGEVQANMDIPVYNSDEVLCNMLDGVLSYTHPLRESFDAYTLPYFPKGINWLEINSLSIALTVRWHQKVGVKEGEGPITYVGAPKYVLEGLGLRPREGIRDTS
ncbi:unnamed protein product [Hermetia illucens]|uniref:Helitron helicase-like domain-containing protein n=1 Tax=Hermetia illucens TaxID=343691 RepID=A0A7R8YQE9_HERIL|nr:unnamed protein product [Hermetia illucens]